MIIKKPIFPNSEIHNKANTNNHKEYEPFSNNSGTNVIDKDWWNNFLNDDIRQRIIDRTNNNFTLDNIEKPHEICVNKEDNFINNVFWSYFEGFDYNKWYTNNIPNGPKNIEFVQITNNIKELFTVHMYTGKPINTENDELNELNELTNFKQKINNSIKKINVEKYFVRLSGTSGKNEKSVEPMHNSDEIINHLASVKQFLYREYSKLNKETHLIIMPWNDKIDQRYEFRIFVVNGKLTGISQQFWTDLFQYSEEELEIFIKAFNDIKFLDFNGSIHKTFVGDVYVDIESHICKLIEMNPFGMYSGAGSSLFNWIDDYEQLYGYKDTIEFRYLSAIDY